MPTLRFDPRAFAEMNGAPAALSILVTMMWPDDEDRQRFELARIVSDKIRSTGGDEAALLDAHSYPNFIINALMAPPTFRKEVPTILRQGQAAGFALLTYMANTLILKWTGLSPNARVDKGESVRTPSNKWSDAKNEAKISFGYRKPGSSPHQEQWPEFNTDIWPYFRPVSHMWAALRIQGDLRKAAAANSSFAEPSSDGFFFPLGMDNLLRFLALAAVVGNWGCQHRSPRQKLPLLKSDALVQAEVDLPYEQRLLASFDLRLWIAIREGASDVYPSPP